MELHEFPEIMDIAEVAEMLRIKKHSVYNLIETGQLKGRRCGKSYRFKKSDVLAWLAGDGGRAA